MSLAASAVPGGAGGALGGAQPVLRVGLHLRDLGRPRPDGEGALRARRSATRPGHAGGRRRRAARRSPRRAAGSAAIGAAPRGRCVRAPSMRCCWPGWSAMPGYAGAAGGAARLFGVVTSVFDVAINTEAAQLRNCVATDTLDERRCTACSASAAWPARSPAAPRSPAAAARTGTCARWRCAMAARHRCWQRSSHAAARSATGVRRRRRQASSCRAARWLLLGVLAALGLIAEGAIYDWSVLYLQQELGSPAAAGRAGLCQLLGGDGRRALRRRRAAGALRARRAAARQRAAGGRRR